MASTYTALLYHIVFSTKHRAPLITETLENELYSYMGGIIRGERGLLLEINGTSDHVHLLTRFRTEPSVATMLRNIKANSSKWVNDTSEKTRTFGWQDGYAAFSVSQSQVGTVAGYIRRQKEHHRQRDFKQELIALLDRHHVEYEARYLWD